MSSIGDLIRQHMEGDLKGDKPIPSIRTIRVPAGGHLSDYDRTHPFCEHCGELKIAIPKDVMTTAFGQRVFDPATGKRLYQAVCPSKHIFACQHGGHKLPKYTIWQKLDHAIFGEPTSFECDECHQYVEMWERDPI